MNLLDSLAVGLRVLRVNKMRSMLTVLGIIIGVAAVVCMVSVGSGARARHPPGNGSAWSGCRIWPTAGTTRAGTAVDYGRGG
jgi:putative ABC transport system permease protein